MPDVPAVEMTGDREDQAQMHVACRQVQRPEAPRRSLALAPVLHRRGLEPVHLFIVATVTLSTAQAMDMALDTALACCQAQQDAAVARAFAWHLEQELAPWVEALDAVQAAIGTLGRSTLLPVLAVRRSGPRRKRGLEEGHSGNRTTKKRRPPKLYGRKGLSRKKLGGKLRWAM